MSQWRTPHRSVHCRAFAADSSDIGMGRVRGIRRAEVPRRSKTDRSQKNLRMRLVKGSARALAPLAPLPQQAVPDGSARIAVGAFPTAGDAEPAWDHCGAGTAVHQGIARPPARNRAFGAAGGVIEMENAQEIQRAEPGATLPGRCDGIWQGSDRLCPRHGPVYPAVIW